MILMFAHVNMNNNIMSKPRALDLCFFSITSIIGHASDTHFLIWEKHFHVRHLCTFRRIIISFFTDDRRLMIYIMSLVACKCCLLVACKCCQLNLCKFQHSTALYLSVELKFFSCYPLFRYTISLISLLTCYLPNKNVPNFISSLL